MLKIVTNTNNASKTKHSTDTETAGVADKKACILKYLGSLECEAEKKHGDDDDWRYGRYLVQGLLIAAMENAERSMH
jgi:hypothetical protein